MSDNLELYKVWAPANAPWSKWAKPVLFASINVNDRHKNKYFNLSIGDIKWMNQADKSTVIIVDLPSDIGVKEGMSLAKVGFRPIPLYNGVRESLYAKPLVDVKDIIKTLLSYSKELENIKLSENAPPAFLLDSNRLKGSKKDYGKFDNRWCIFPQDMPSVNYLLSKDITKVIVRSESIQYDLSHILYRYQEKGIRIFLCHNGTNIKETKVNRPRRFKSILYRLSVLFGFRRNSTGGFGGIIPDPANSTGLG